MTVSKVFVLHGFSTDTNFYSQLESSSLNNNIETMTVTPSGHTIPVFTAENGRRPEMQFTTHQVRTALAELGLLGADAGTIVLRLRKVANKGSRVAAATTEHITYTANCALSYAMTIAAGAKKQATISGRHAFLNDGTNAALIYSGTAAQSGASTGGENFILGPIAHNGTFINGTDNLSIDLGPELIEPEEEILNEPTFAAIDRIVPTISFDTLDADVWALDGTAITNGLKLNLIRKRPDLDRFADADAQHILFTVAKGRIECESVSGNKSLTKVKIHAVSPDGTASPIAVTLDSAIDTAAIV
ncbi:MAG: hypothetical protein ABJZ55_02010 [Fuerstiella sp.]